MRDWLFIQLSEKPILKGAFPAFTSYLISNIDSVNFWVKTGTLWLGFVIALLTVLVKIRDLFKVKR